MGVGRYLIRVTDRGAGIIDADGGTVEGFRLAGIGLLVAVVAFPEMRAFQEFQPRRGDVHRLKAVDETEDLRPVAGAVKLAQLLHEGQDGGADHDVIEHLGIGRDLREIAGERRLGRRDGDLADHLAALRLNGGGEEIAVVMAEGIVRKDHRDLLAKVLRDPGRHRLHLAFHIGDARLKRPAVQHAGGDVVALGTDKIRHLQLCRARRGADDDMGEKRTIDQIAIGLGRELAKDLGAARGIGAVILEHDLDRAAADATLIVQDLQRGGRGALIPAAIGRADPSPMQLKPKLDRRRGLRLHEARRQPGRQKRTPCRHTGQDRTASRHSHLVRHQTSPLLITHGFPRSSGFF